MSFDVYDDGSIQSYLAGFSDGPATAQLLTLCLERALRKGPDGLRPLTILPPDAPGWLRSKFNAGDSFHHFVPDAALNARVLHVADWIAAAVINDEAWLKDCDGQGRPKKLLQVGTLERAQQMANEAMRRFSFKSAAAPYTEGEGEESVMTFADGSRIVRLLTPEALDRESAMMGHCVGQGAYDASVRDRSRIIYSLRGHDGKAHVTFDVKAARNELLQCKGKENAPPVARYMPQVQAFITSQRFVLQEAAYMTGLVQDKAGHVHSVAALPEGLTISGHLDLSCAAITALPEGLSVGGNLDLRGTAITVLPEGLSVGGSLQLYGSAITALPKVLTVGGYVDLRGTAITALPEKLKVGGDLVLRGTAITVLPEKLKVGGRIHLPDAMRSPWRETMKRMLGL